MVDLVSYVIVVTEIDFSPCQWQSSLIDDEIGDAALDPAMTGLSTDEQLPIRHQEGCLCGNLHGCLIVDLYYRCSSPPERLHMVKHSVVDLFLPKFNSYYT